MGGYFYVWVSCCLWRRLCWRAVGSAGCTGITRSWWKNPPWVRIGRGKGCQAGTCQTTLHQIRLHQARVHQTTLHQIRLHRTRLHQARKALPWQTCRLCPRVMTPGRRDVLPRCVIRGSLVPAGRLRPCLRWRAGSCLEKLGIFPRTICHMTRISCWGRPGEENTQWPWLTSFPGGGQ